MDVSSNMKWQKLYKSTQDAYIVFADNVNKVNRADGKVCEVNFRCEKWIELMARCEGSALDVRSRMSSWQVVRGQF